MVSALLLILHYKELAVLAPCHCASCVVGIVGDLCIIVGVQYALQVVRFVHYCKLCITGNWLHLLGGFRQEGRVRCHQERVCPSSRPLILQRVSKREKCWMSWFSFHNLSRIVNCAIGHSHSSLSLSLSLSLVLSLSMSLCLCLWIYILWWSVCLCVCLSKNEHFLLGVFLWFQVSFSWFQVVFYVLFIVAGFFMV